MRVGLRLKLFLVSVGLILTSFFAADLYLAGALEAQFLERAHEDEITRVNLVERDASASPASLDDLDAWTTFARELGRRAHARISVIRLDGKVVGDSEFDVAGLATLESHAERPEVVQALANGSGSSVRESASLHNKRLAYVAVPFTHDGARAGVVRLAIPLTEVDDAVARLHHVLLLATAAACIAAIVMSSLAAHWMARLVRALTVAARRMAGGDLAVRTHVPGTDEVAELGGALDQLARSLSDAMTQLRTERDLLSGILDGMEEGVLVLDQRGRILRVNPALRSMLYIGSEALGRPLIEVVRNAELKELVDAARNDPASGEVDISGLKPRRVLVRAAMLPGDDKALLVVCRDVTDVRRLETMRRDFVANVSHELRTPVTAVRSAAETLRDGAYADPDAAKRFVDIIARNAERLQRLIEDLLDLSRIESKQLKLSFEPVHVRSFVAHALSLFRDRADKRNVQLKADIPERLPAVYADRRALEQIVSNLVDNAVKYCPGASVTVRACEMEAGIEIVVADTGSGIDAKHVPRIFERFYRVDAGRSRELGGTGLGLSIVKHLAEAMGGTIVVESAVGSGTSFTVALPRATRPEAQPRPPEPAATTSS